MGVGESKAQNKWCHACLMVERILALEDFYVYILIAILLGLRKKGPVNGYC